MIYVRSGFGPEDVHDLVPFGATLAIPLHLEVAGKLCLRAGPHLVGDRTVQVVGSLLPLLGLEGQLVLLVDGDGLHGGAFGTCVGTFEVNMKVRAQCLVSYSEPRGGRRRREPPLRQPGAS